MTDERAERHRSEAEVDGAARGGPHMPPENGQSIKHGGDAWLAPKRSAAERRVAGACPPCSLQLGKRNPNTNTNEIDYTHS